MPAEHDLNRSISVLSARIRRRFAQRMALEEWAQEKGLRTGCFSVLRTVVEAGSLLSQRQVGEQVGVDPSDIVALIDLLEAAGYVERRRDDADRRRYLLDATPSGRTAYRRYVEISDEVEDEVFAVLKAKERERLTRLVHTVVAAEILVISEPADR